MRAPCVILPEFPSEEHISSLQDLPGNILLSTSFPPILGKVEIIDPVITLQIKTILSSNSVLPTILIPPRSQELRHGLFSCGPQQRAGGLQGGRPLWEATQLSRPWSPRPWLRSPTGRPPHPVKVMPWGHHADYGAARTVPSSGLQVACGECIRVNRGNVHELWGLWF